jgi:hypothetical protein
VENGLKTGFEQSNFEQLIFSHLNVITLGLRETDNINQISLILVYSDAINYLILSNIQTLLRAGVSNSNWLERRIGVVYEPAGCMHKCTLVENPGEGIPDVFCQNPKGSWGKGQGFQEKLPGGSPYFGFYCIFINKCFEIYLRGYYIYPTPYPHLTSPMCIYGCMRPKKGFSGPHKF